MDRSRANGFRIREAAATSLADSEAAKVRAYQRGNSGRAGELQRQFQRAAVDESFAGVLSMGMTTRAFRMSVTVETADRRWIEIPLLEPGTQTPMTIEAVDAIEALSKVDLRKTFTINPYLGMTVIAVVCESVGGPQ
jgi:hypothetical protein